MVAQRERVHAAVKEELGGGRRDAVAVGGVFRIADHQINALDTLERRELAADKAAADAAHHVAYT